MTAHVVTLDTATTVASPMASVRSYLIALASMTGQMGYKVSIEKLTLYLGHEYPRPAVARPDTVTKGPNKECFRNARRLALRSSRYRYVEGYALSDIGFPCHHAWVLDADGHTRATVVETTWAVQGHAYFGVEISREELRSWRAGVSILDARCHVLHADLEARRLVWG